MNQYRLAVSGERDGLWDWDLVSNRVHFSPRWIAMVGCEDSNIGTSPDEWLRRIHPEDEARVRGDLEAHLAGGRAEFDIHHRMRRADGSYRWMACRGVVVRDSRGVPIRLMGLHADVNADYVADPLTGLPNRELFVDRLSRAVERTRRNPEFLYAVLLIDVHRTLPEDAARQAEHDPLLTVTARRLESGLRGTAASPFPGEDYVVARLHDSQFAVLLEGLERVGEAQVAADRVLTELLAPLQVQGRQLFPSASIGIAVSATGYGRVEDAMRDADAALYRARSLGANRCEVFDLALVQSAQARLAIEADLEHALERGEFLLFYQPVVEAASRRIVGFEALARWRHPTRGMIPPHDFIPIAERTGLIISLENWTLREACRQLTAWQASVTVPEDLWVSVNLSGIQFRQPGIVERVGEALRDAGVDAARLVLELTESVVLEDPAAVRTLLMQLRIMGVRISIDDFGTGHSSFAYLHQLPADFLKVDQSFVRGVEVRPDKADIVGTLAELAGQLGLRVIAEGIESEAGLEQVRLRRCEYLQGFLFSHPVDAEAAAALLTSGLPVVADSSANERTDPPTFSNGRARLSAHASTGKDAARRLWAGVATRATEAGTRMRGYAMAAAAALVVVTSVGLPDRLVTESLAPTPPAAPRPAAAAPFMTPSPPAVGIDRARRRSGVPAGRTVSEAVTAAPAATGAALPEGSPTSSVGGRDSSSAGGDGSARAARPGPAASSVAPHSLQRAPMTLAVEHQHVFGGCKGILRVSSSGVSFTSDDEKDAFVFEPGRFESTLKGDGVTIKDGRRTYRFKVRPGTRGGDPRPALRQAFDAMPNLKPR